MHTVLMYTNGKRLHLWFTKKLSIIESLSLSLFFLHQNNPGDDRNSKRIFVRTVLFIHDSGHIDRHSPTATVRTYRCLTHSTEITRITRTTR